jgi:putative transposase
MIRAYKYRIYPNKTQLREMQKHLWLSKNLWNELLAHTKQMYNDYGMFATVYGMRSMAKRSGLFSQTEQDIILRLDRSTKRFLQARKRGEDVGFPRFKSTNRVKSICYPQDGFKLLDKKHLKVTPFGTFRIVQHREITGKIKTMSLKRESSGKWFVIFTCDQPQITPPINTGTPIGIDMGLKTFAVTSENESIKNPRFFQHQQDRLSLLQRKTSKKHKQSNNRNKANHKVSIQYEHVTNQRKDFLHKLSTRLVNQHSLIVLEKLNIHGMEQINYGKSINDASWGTFANMLTYKAENAGSKVIFVDPTNTTKECHVCHNIQHLTLADRIYNCPKCGLSENRDLNASKNILARGTVGYTGTNASGDGIVPSKNEEIHIFCGCEYITIDNHNNIWSMI